MATFWQDLKLSGDALTDWLGVTQYAAAQEYAEELADAGASTDTQSVALQGAMSAEDGGAIGAAASETVDQVESAAKGALSAFTLPLILAVAALGLWFLGPFIKKELPK